MATAPSAQGTLIVVRLVHEANALDAIDLGVPSKVINVKDSQERKAELSMLVTLDGNEVNANFEHL